jgi:hypothetical protein
LIQRENFLRSHQIEPFGRAFGSRAAGKSTKKLRPPVATGVLLESNPTEEAGFFLVVLIGPSLEG